MKQIIFTFILFTTALIIFPDNVLAAEYTCGSNPAIYPSLKECQDAPCSNCILVSNPSAPAPISLPNPLGEGKTDIPILLGKIINSVLGIIGSLALVMFIYGGATWMLSGGNQEQVTKGKNILIWAAAGLVIIFTAYALVKFVLTTVTMTT